MDIDNIDFDTISTTCNNPVKPLTKEIVEEAIEAVKRDMKKIKFDYKPSARRMTGFNKDTNYINAYYTRTI